MSGLFNKSKRNRGNVRKRGGEEDEVPDGEETEIVRENKMHKKNPLAFSTKREGAGESVKLLYKSDRQLQQADDQGATREVETETATDRDARYVSLFRVIDFDSA